jgi:endogenous inhibitor of DNA gyrase (YacG/DUF329 family)
LSEWNKTSYYIKNDKKYLKISFRYLLSDAEKELEIKKIFTNAKEIVNFKSYSEIYDFIKSYYPSNKKKITFIMNKGHIFNKIIKDNLKIILEGKYPFKPGDTFKIDYYLFFGHSKEYAEKQIKELKEVSNQSLKSFIKRYGQEEGERRYKEFCYKSGKSVRLEYWLKKGYSIDEAKEKLKDRQSMSLKRFIKIYGENEGLKRYKEWKTKSTSFHQFYSNESIIFFQPIYDWLLKNGFADSDIYWKDNEYCLYDDEKGHIKFYDFVIPKLKLVFEYNGSMWHYNPNYDYKENFKNPFGSTLNELKENDNYKKNLAIKNNFEVIEIFDTDNQKEKQKEIINLIKEKKNEN